MAEVSLCINTASQNTSADSAIQMAHDLKKLLQNYEISSAPSAGSNNQTDLYIECGSGIYGNREKCSLLKHCVLL